MIKNQLIAKLRKENPLIHNITNTVVANYVANGLLALGASPIMSSAKQEMDDLARICSAVVINIGTLTNKQMKAMLISGKAANCYNTPVLLDPVGIGATSFRLKAVRHLLAEIQFAAIRGNAGEMAVLADIDWQTKGVDVGSGSANISRIADTVAKKYNTVAVVSGKIDIISDGKQLVEVKNGSNIFSQITGSGCLHGAVCAAFIAAAPDQIFSACATASVTYAIAGELAVKDNVYCGTFTTALLDSLARIKANDVAQLKNIRMIA